MPEEALVVGTNEEVVTAGVNVEGGDPPGAGEEGTDLLLCREIVNSDISLSSDKEMRFERMKKSGLGETPRFAEGGLGVVFAELVDKNRLIGT